MQSIEQLPPRQELLNKHVVDTDLERTIVNELVSATHEKAPDGIYTIRKLLEFDQDELKHILGSQDHVQQVFDYLHSLGLVGTYSAKTLQDNLDLYLSELDLDSVIVGFLEAADIFTVNDLLCLTPSELEGLDNIADTRLEKIFAALEKIGFIRWNKRQEAQTVLQILES